MHSLIPNSHRLIYFMEGKKALRASRCPRRLSGRVRARRVKTVSSHLKHGASLYLKFEGLNLSVVIIFKTFHLMKNFESCSVVSVVRQRGSSSVLLRQRKVILRCCETRADLQSHLPDNYLANSFDT